MRNFSILIASFFYVNSLFAQPPQMFNYQALVRDARGNAVTNQQVSFQFSILEGSDVGTAIYTETHADEYQYREDFSLG